MKTLHTIGCSFTHGSELLGVDIYDTPHQYRNQTFTHHIADSLGYDDYKIWALPGASNRTISDITVDVIQKNPTDDVFVFWSWAFRSQYWHDAHKAMDSDGNELHTRSEWNLNPGLVIKAKKYSKTEHDTYIPWTREEMNMLEWHWLNAESDFEWGLKSLRDIMLVDSFAKSKGCNIKHFHIGDSFVKIPENYANIQRVTGNSFSHIPNGTLTTETDFPSFSYHALLQEYINMKNIYRFKNNNGLWREVDAWINGSDQYYIGSHWNAQGHALAAHFIIKALMEDI